MNNLSKLLGSMVLLTTAMGAANVLAASPAGAAVFQRTENTQSIELSNIEDESAMRAPVAVETAVAVVAKTALQGPAKTPARLELPRKVKLTPTSDNAEDAEVAEGEETESRQAQADTSHAGGKDHHENASDTDSSNTIASVSGLGDVVYSGGTGAIASSGTGNVPNASVLPVATPALDTKLEQYRNQMLQDVANAQVANPAITRRYQMMDKATYQSRTGL